MTPDERDMLMGLFDRMRAHGAIDKDSQAEALIFQEVRKIPDSAYMLVQSVLVQEQALEGAQAQIEQLQARVQELEAASRAATEQSSGGGFLGGMFGGKKAAPARPASPWGDAPASASVPSARPGGPWGNAAGNAGGYANQQAPMQQPQARSAGGGFMKSALATAAGVAGGMILMDSLKNMMGGTSGAQAGESGGFGSNDQGDGRWADAQQDAAQDQELASNDFEDNNDQGYSDTSSDGWGGGDSGSDT